MPHLEVCLTPEIIHLTALKGKLVVVTDILRATTSMTTAMAHGAESIIPVSSLEECTKLKDEGHLAAAERNGEMPEGFDFGNSPFSYMCDTVKGQKIAFTTTNGTKAINLSKEADDIIIGSFLNLSAIAAYVLNTNKDTVIVCSGWKGQFSFEDTLFAGALIDKVISQFEMDNDAALAAQILYKNTNGDIYNALQQSAHCRRLAKLNVIKDIEFCSNIDKFNIVPRLVNSELVIAS